MSEGSALQKSLRRFGCGVNFSIDEEPTGVRTSGAVKLPGDHMALPGQLCPFRGFGCILLKPEMVVVIDERAKARVSETIGPGIEVGQLRCHWFARCSTAVVHSLIDVYAL